jgi:hypothetical protein
LPTAATRVKPARVQIESEESPGEKILIKLRTGNLITGYFRIYSKTYRQLVLFEEKKYPFNQLNPLAIFFCMRIKQIELIKPVWLSRSP